VQKARLKENERETKRERQKEKERKRKRKRAIQRKGERVTQGKTKGKKERDRATEIPFRHHVSLVMSFSLFYVFRNLQEQECRILLFEYSATKRTLAVEHAKNLIYCKC